MKKVQLFSENDIESLQLKINSWLADNKDAHITETNLSITGEPGSEVYAFYILYGIINEEAKEIGQSAVEGIPSVVQTEIKADMLKSSN